MSKQRSKRTLSITGRTILATRVSEDGNVAIVLRRDGKEVLVLSVERESTEPKTSTTVTISKHPGNLIIEG